MSIKMESNLEEIIKKLEDAATRGIEDVLDTLQIETKDISRIDTGKTSESYETVTEVGPQEGIIQGAIGSNEMNAIWEEFGTGLYAENGDGRQDPWVYRGSDGNWYTTVGKTANAPLRGALAKRKAQIPKLIEKSFKEEFK